MAKRQYNKWRELEDGTIEIELTQGKTALIDAEDRERVLEYKWYAYFNGCHWYARTSLENAHRRSKMCTLHQFLLENPQGMDIDHINRNGLDCRKMNLRLATRSQNNANQCKSKTQTSSRYKGVSKASRRKTWRAYIMVAGRTRSLGAFATEREAARAYNAAAQAYFGEFARLNDVPE